MTGSDSLRRILTEYGFLLAAAFVVLLVALSLGLRFALKNSTRQSGFIAVNLVLRRYDLNPDDSMNLVYMVGRKAGFWGWLWSELGIAKSYEMHVSERFVMIMAPGVRDGTHAVIPTESIVTAAYEYTRPLRALLVAMGLTLLVPILLVWHGHLLHLHDTPAHAWQAHTWQAQDPAWYDTILGRSGLALTGPEVTIAVIGGAAIFFIYYMVRRGIRILVSAGDGYWGFHYLVGAAGNFEKAARTLAILRTLITTRAGARSSPPSLPLPTAMPMAATG